jgi:hypothetical protein
LLNNLANTGVFGGAGGSIATPVFSTGVTQNGLIFTADPAAQEQNNGGTAGLTLIGVDFSWALYGGATAATATDTTGSLVASETGTAIVGDNANWGQFAGPATAASVAGTTASGTVYLDLYVWEGNTFSSYTAALAGADYTGTSGVFSQASGGGANPPPALIGLPDVLVSVPEPTTLALAALGGASLLMFRRKK